MSFVLSHYWQRKEIESEVAQSCSALCNSMDCSPPGSSIHVILQARILEWVAISFSKGSFQPRDWNWSLWATREAYCQRNHILYMPLCTWWWKIPVVREPWAGDPGEMSQEHSGDLRDISVCKNNSNNWKPNCSQSLSFLFYFHLLNEYLLSGYHGTSAVRQWRIQ